MITILTTLAYALDCTSAIAQGPYVPVVSHDSLVVWVRFDSSLTASLRYSYDGVGWYYTLPEVTKPNLANTARWTVPAQGYDHVQYAVVVSGCEPSPSRTTTFAPALDSIEPFEFAVTADAFKTNQQASPPWASIAESSPAFVFQIGDFDHRNPGINGNTDIAAWRVMNRDVLGDKPVGHSLDRHLFSNGIPFFHTWDDHDWCYNNADASCPGRDAALRSFHEFYPTPSTVGSTIAYSVRWGALAEFFVLDSRSARTESSLLGAEQSLWLAQSVVDSTADFKVILSSSVWNPNAKQIDAWAAYPGEQQRLIDYWTAHDTKGIVILTGDMHSVGLIDDGTHGTFPNVSVPPINLSGKGCTGGPCGEWSVPWTEVQPHAGYGWFQIYRDESGSHMLLSNRSNTGTVRNQYLVNLEFTHGLQ